MTRPRSCWTQAIGGDCSPLGYFAIVVTATMALSSLTYDFAEAPALWPKKRTDGGKPAKAGIPDVEATVRTPIGPDAVLPAMPDR